MNTAYTALRKQCLDALEAGGKIQAIKSIREGTRLGLKEAKDFVDTLPRASESPRWHLESEYDHHWGSLGLEIDQEWSRKNAHTGVPYVGVTMPAVHLDLTPFMDVLLQTHALIKETNELIGDLIHVIQEGD